MTKENSTCAPFPFTYNGRSYDGCAFDVKTDEDPWCPTKLNEHGEFVIKETDIADVAASQPEQQEKKNWGSCTASCNIDSTDVFDSKQFVTVVLL